MLFCVADVTCSEYDSNPDFSIESTLGPAETVLKTKVPLGPVVVWLEMFVDKSVSVTAAEGIAAPVASTTFPWTCSVLRGGTIPRAVAQNKLQNTIPHTTINLRTFLNPPKKFGIGSG